VADVLIERLVGARDQKALKATTRALDRAVLWNFNVVPRFQSDEIWFASRDKFGYPERMPTCGIGFPPRGGSSRPALSPNNKLRAMIA
jgi:microcin C transport system substrate-binding protein